MSKERRKEMSRKTKMKILKILLAILAISLIVGVMIYLFPVMQDLSSVQ